MSFAAARAYERGRQRIREQNEQERDRQTLLRLNRTYRPVLVGIDQAMSTLGYDCAVVLDMVDAGELLWVFDVACVGAGRRELRFWLGELMAPAFQRSATLDVVLNCVVGHELLPDIRNQTVSHILGVRHTTVHRLWKSGELAGVLSNRTLWIHRAGLVAFLRARWVGNNAQQERK